MPETTTSHVRCDVCGSALALTCEGLQGFWGYRTYNAYFCPHCNKQNHALTSGAIIGARLIAIGA